LPKLNLGLGGILEKFIKDPRTFIGALVIMLGFLTMPLVFYFIPEIRNEYYIGVMFLLFSVVSYYFSAKTGEKLAMPIPDEKIAEFIAMLGTQLAEVLSEKLIEMLEKPKEE